MKKFLLIAAMLLSPCLMVAAQDDEVSKESDAVRQVVQAYLDGKNPETKRRALYPEAKIFSGNSKSGKIVETSVSKPSKPMPAGATTISPVQRIVAIDVAQDGAMVKVESEFPPYLTIAPRTHVQFLSLLKLNGEWKIVSILMPSSFVEKASR